MDATGSPTTLPVGLVVAGRRAVVAGAGPVGARRAAALAERGASVVALDPEPEPPVVDLAERGALTLHRRPARPADFDGAFLAVVAAGDPATNRRLADAARDAGALVSVADAPEASDLHWAAVARRGGVQVGVTAGAAGPGLAVAVRDRVETGLPDGLDRLAELVAELRASGALPSAPGTPWGHLLDPGILAALRRGDPATARERLRAVLDEAGDTGR